MIPARKESPTEEVGPFQLALLLLSVALLTGIAVESLFTLPREIERLILYIDSAVCTVLLLDVAARFWSAPRKLQFLKWGWIDLLASIPSIEMLRWGRLFRIVRIVRVLVALRSMRRIMQAVVRNRGQAGLASILVLTFLVLSFASAGVLYVETAPESNIHTAEDALWWSLTTVTTVGYGDRYPVTNAGRAIAGVLMICGIGLFGTLSGVAATYFIGGKTPQQPGNGALSDAMTARVKAIEDQLAAKRPTDFPIQRDFVERPTEHPTAVEGRYNSS